MIRARHTGAVTVLTLEGEHRFGFIDSDWIGAGEHAPGLLVDSQEGVWWDGERLWNGEGDPRRFTEALLGDQAEAIAAAVKDVDPQRVWVIGDGLVASAVRRLLGQAPAPRDGERGQTRAVRDSPGPLAAIDLTSVALERACQAVPDGGTVVLAGERRERCDIDLYKHVHRRGLKVVGIPDLRNRVRSLSRNDSTFHNGSPSRGQAAFPEPVTVVAGEPLPSALWYRLVSR